MSTPKDDHFTSQDIKRVLENVLNRSFDLGALILYRDSFIKPQSYGRTVSQIRGFASKLKRCKSFEWHKVPDNTIGI